MAQAEKSLYEILGVRPDADEREIRRAFRSRARELHPDVSRESDAVDRFAELSRAYSVLGTPTTRLLYDRVGYLGRGNGLFEARPRRDRVADVFELAEVQVGAFEAARGVTQRVDVPFVGVCLGCAGTGAAPGTAVDECGRCGGEGLVRASGELGGARLLQLATCETCRGRGRLIEAPCDACEGSGKTSSTRSLTLRIPPGSEDGSVIRAESGAPADGGTRPRDVYVRVRVLPDRDPPLVRYAAAVALALALALFVVLALVPGAV